MTAPSTKIGNQRWSRLGATLLALCLAGAFAPPVTAADTADDAFVSGDFDGDGDVDLRMRISGAGELVYLLNDGAGSFDARIVMDRAALDAPLHGNVQRAEGLEKGELQPLRGRPRFRRDAPVPSLGLGPAPLPWLPSTCLETSADSNTDEGWCLGSSSGVPLTVDGHAWLLRTPDEHEALFGPCADEEHAPVVPPVPRPGEVLVYGSLWWSGCCGCLAVECVHHADVDDVVRVVFRGSAGDGDCDAAGVEGAWAIIEDVGGVIELAFEPAPSSAACTGSDPQAGEASPRTATRTFTLR